MTEEQVSLRRSGIWGAIAFGVALAVIVGVRLEQAALAVIIGVICGVGASIPTSLLIVAILRHRDAQHTKRQAQRNHSAPQPPQIVVVAPPNAPQVRSGGQWPEEYSLPVPGQRQFAIIGDEEIEQL
jgi:hypothetical protein